MEQQSNKHGRVADEQLKHELAATLRTGQQSHPEEWLQTEPSGDDQPTIDRSPDAPEVVGTPVGLDLADVERRAEVASYLGKEIYPADRDSLLTAAAERGAPDLVLDDLRRLPGDRLFVNLNDAWSSLGHSVERHRS